MCMGLLFNFGNISGDNPLDHYKWKKVTTFLQKQWGRYVAAFISSITAKTCCGSKGVAQTRKLLFCSLKKAQFQRHINQRVHLFKRTIQYLLFSIHVNNIKFNQKQMFLLTYVNSFELQLQDMLRSILVFHQLTIFGIHSHCQQWLEVKHNSQSPQFSFKFCGVYSSLNIYPPKPKLMLSLQEGVQKKEAFSLFATFDLTGNNFIQTKEFDADTTPMYHTILFPFYMRQLEAFIF